MKIINVQNKLRLIVIFIVAFSGLAFGATKKTIKFPSVDSVEITADVYLINENQHTPLIVLFHQAGWSRGEYLEIAPKLNMLGFNCIAIDLRSGGEINGITNETAISAVQAQKSTKYIDALPDIIASLIYVKKSFNSKKIIAWGSSYSAALVLQIAGTQPDLVDGVLAFAPGEYFAKLGKPKTWIQDSAAHINVPVFITSAHDERKLWAAIYNAIQSQNKSSFLPTTEGNHGSRALWEEFADSDDYWNAVTEFLRNNFL